MFWTDGTIYKGRWKKGVQHGTGEIITPEGTVHKGKFENNKLVPKSKKSEFSMTNKTP